MKEQHHVFKKVCLGCGARNKLVSRCVGCYRLVCVECSINGACNDCYIRHNFLSEMILYNQEKGVYVRSVER